MPIPTPRLGPTAAALLLALAACAPSAPRPEQARPVPTVVPPPATVPTASAAPIPSVAPDAGPTEVPLLPTPFHIIAQGTWLRMHASGEHVLVMGSDLQAELDGDTLVRSARLGRGLPKTPYSVVHFAGDFPEPFAIKLFDSRQNVREPITTYRYQKTGWQRVDKGPLRNMECVWHGPGGNVAIFTGESFERWSGPPSAKLPSMPPSKSNAPQDPSLFSSKPGPRCLPDGHVFAVADGPPRGPELLRIAVWKPDDKLPSIMPVPLVPMCDRTTSFCHVNLVWLDAKGPRDVWLMGMAPMGRGEDKLFLTHFDGVSWAQLEVPPAHDFWNLENVSWIKPFAVGDDGTAWIIRSRSEGPEYELWRRSQDGTWARVAMPRVANRADELTPRGVLVRGKDDVWVAANNSDTPVQWFMLRTKPQPVVTSTSPMVEVKP